jgi:uncharacterized protein (TIGR02147 family)
MGEEFAPALPLQSVARLPTSPMYSPGDRDFSPEQAEALARFFSLRHDEVDYFLLLVEWARAGTPQLREVVDRRLKKCGDQYRDLKTRVKTQGKIRSEDQATYYSSWHYQAIRTVATLPDSKTAPKIARRLGLPIERVTEVLSFLLSKGLIKEDKDGYVRIGPALHLGSDSPMINQLHTNWRLHTVTHLERKNPEDLHYSGVITLSHTDFQRVREIWVKSLLKSHEIIEPSADERICAMTLDFYEL